MRTVRNILISTTMRAKPKDKQGNLDIRNSSEYLIIYSELYKIVEENKKLGKRPTLDRGALNKSYNSIVKYFNNVGGLQELINCLLKLCDLEEDITFRGIDTYFLKHAVFDFVYPNLNPKLKLLDDRLNKLYQQEKIPFIRRNLSLIYSAFNLDKTIKLLKDQVREYRENTEAGYEASTKLKEIKEKGIEAILSGFSDPD